MTLAAISKRTQQAKNQSVVEGKRQQGLALALALAVVVFGCWKTKLFCDGMSVPGFVVLKKSYNNPVISILSDLCASSGFLQRTETSFY